MSGLHSAPAALPPGVILPRTGISGTLLGASQTAYFSYLTRVATAYTSAKVMVNVSVAAGGTITYQEVGIYKGALTALGTVPSLTRVAAGAIALGTTTGVKSATLSLAGLVLPGDELWVCIAAQFGTTQPTYTAVAADPIATGVHATQATYQPTTGASPVVPTATGAAIPMLAVQLI